MTPQEQQLLQGLTDRVNQTVLTEKDPEAEQFINQALGRNPDAIYILAQTVLVQQYALDQAKQQLDQAKQQQQQPPAPQKHTSFLGNLLGMNDEPAPPPPPPAPRYAPAQQQGYAPVPQPGYAQPGYAQPGYAQSGYAPQFGPPAGGFFGGGGQPGGGSFLRSAMTTATGVAAGALAFEGIESLMHGFEHHAGYGSGFDGGMGGGRPEEIINNNYYGDSAPGHEGHGDLADRLAASGDHPSPDIEDRRDDNRSAFADTGNDTQSNDLTDDSSDDQSFDQPGDTADDTADDSSSFDDSGSDFDSGGGDDSNS